MTTAANARFEPKLPDAAVDSDGSYVQGADFAKLPSFPGSNLGARYGG